MFAHFACGIRWALVFGAVTSLTSLAAAQSASPNSVPTAALPSAPQNVVRDHITADSPPALTNRSGQSNLVRVVVPAAAGGSSDAAARLVTNHFQAVFRQPFIIENKPGNGNALGAAFVAQAEPDGHTLLLSNSASNLTVPLVARNAGYDPVADFNHIVMLTSSPYVFAVYPGLGVNTLAAFVAKARAEKLAYTAANRGGLGNIGGRVFPAAGRHLDAARALQRRRTGGR
jgi:hypothetical protein